ncbi:MAG: FtsX-like permease family protein [Pirellulales bacterium]
MSRVAPLVFLAVTAILMHLVVSRLIGTQREQIATLAAFGYTSFEIGSHFLKLALVVLVWGAAMGVPLGWWLGVNLAEMYTHFFRFPQLTFELDPLAVVSSMTVASVAAMGGVAQAVARAIRIRPAAAMQPEPPAVYRVSVLERLGIGPVGAADFAGGGGDGARHVCGRRRGASGNVSVHAGATLRPFACVC